MLKKLSILAAAVALAGLALSAFAPTASAEEPVRAEDTFLRGRGILSAHGTGLVAVKGHIDLKVTAERGILLVKDIAGDADVDVRGTGGTGQFHGFDVYFGVDGAAHVTGSDVAVIVLAQDIRLEVIGKGWAFLKGRGEYMVNNRGPFPWSEDGAFAAIVSDASDAP